MKKIVAIFDLDSTLTKKDTYVAFLVHVLRRYPQRLWRTIGLPFAIIIYKLGFKDNSWLKQVFLTAICGGLNRQQIQECTDKFIDNLFKKGIHQQAFEAIKSHQQAGHQLVMATASFDFYSQQLGRRLGFNRIICTQSAWQAEILSGKILGKNCYGFNKKQQLITAFPVRQAYEIIAYSDHHSDVPFLAWADQAIAINPTAKLKKMAQQQHFEIQYWQ